MTDTYTALVALLEALASDCENTDGWQDAANTPKEAAEAITTLQSQLAEAREALELVMVGGNHLGLLIGADHPPHSATCAEALEHYGPCDAYEAWCCWRTIMQVRALKDQNHD